MIGDPLLRTNPRRRRHPALPASVWIPVAVMLILAWANATLP
jgi:hypothetical protein